MDNYTIGMVINHAKNFYPLQLLIRKELTIHLGICLTPMAMKYQLESITTDWAKIILAAAAREPTSFVSCFYDTETPLATEVTKEATAAIMNHKLSDSATLLITKLRVNAALCGAENITKDNKLLKALRVMAVSDLYLNVKLVHVGKQIFNELPNLLDNDT